MSKSKQWFITVLLVGIAAAYIYIYRDWFKSPTVQIYHRVATGRPGWQRRKNPQPDKTQYVIFGFDRRLELTRVKVLRVDELATNADALPVWHLVSQSNSVPLKGFIYGDFIKGMQSFVKGTHPQPLESNVTYRLFIEAGSKKGQHDFGLGETNAAGPLPAQ